MKSGIVGYLELAFELIYWLPSADDYRIFVEEFIAFL